jgi:hypothetical protein
MFELSTDELANDPSLIQGEISPSTSTPLPTGWSEHVDPCSKTRYYFNTETGKTQWNRPYSSASTNLPENLTMAGASVAVPTFANGSHNSKSASSCNTTTTRRIEKSKIVTDTDTDQTHSPTRAARPKLVNGTILSVSGIKQQLSHAEDTAVGVKQQVITHAKEVHTGMDATKLLLEELKMARYSAAFAKEEYELDILQIAAQHDEAWRGVLGSTGLISNSDEEKRLRNRLITFKLHLSMNMATC